MTTSRPSAVRVYLFTYRRNQVLPRALRSLLAQTHTDWVCEVHNDDPADPYPADLVSQIADPRVTYVPHPINLGPSESFNKAFMPVREPFVSILEDDNWWEPRLLESLLAAIASYPSINLVWANSHMWREGADGEWRREGTIWPVVGDPLTIFDVPHPRQVCQAIHSNGAMLLRVTPETMRPSPQGMPFFAVEPIRERTYPGPLLLVREPLANYALTLETSRTETADENLQALVLLALSFMKRCPDTPAFYERMWIESGGARGHRHRALVVAAAMAGRLRRLVSAAAPLDLAVVAGWALRHPARFRTLFAAPRRFPEVDNFLRSAINPVPGRAPDVD